MYVNAWMHTIAFWNPSWSSHPLGIASISSSIVRKQICSLICVAHCNELAKYSQAFWKKRESPHQWIYDPWLPRVPCSCACLSDMETVENLFGLFLHSHTCNYVGIFLLFFFFNDYVFLFVFLPSNASNTWGEAQRRVTCVNENKRRKAEKKHREAGSTAECGK